MQIWPDLRILLDAGRLRFYLVKGDLEKAGKLVEQQDWRVEARPVNTFLSLIAYAKFLAFQGKWCESYQLLNGALGELQKDKFLTPVIYILALQASILYSQNQRALAVEKIEQALTFAQTEGFVRIILDEGEPARHLIAQCRLQKSQQRGEEMIYRGYVQSRLNDAFGKPYHFMGVTYGWGTLTSALLFGLSHTGLISSVLGLPGEITIPWGVWTFFSGLVFGLVREKTGSILAPALLHGLPQAIAVVVMWYI